MKSFKQHTLFMMLILCGLLSITACDNAASSSSDQKPESEQLDLKTSDSNDQKKVAPAPTNERYAWVDQLNIRDEAGTKGKVITKVSINDVLTFDGETNGKPETIVLRGVAYTEPWMKIKTPDGKEGWVFGGAIKSANEEKGNAPITDTKFDFPKFGSFDLSSWKKIKTNESQGGDAESTTKTYEKDGQKLEIDFTEVGEYGYFRRYKLSNSDGKVLKEREFHFAADAQPKELSETVKDFSSSPPKQYERMQKIEPHFMSLNAKPQMAQGTWKSTTLEAKPTESFSFEIFESSDPMPKELDLDSGCGCTFRSQSDDYQTTIFQSNYEDPPKAYATIQVDGKYILLKSAKFENPDYKRGDYHVYYYNDTYDLKIVAFKEGTDDGGGPQYSGTIKLTLKDGTELANINTFGGCGC